jgi:hypothetical protein
MPGSDWWYSHERARREIRKKERKRRKKYRRKRLRRMEYVSEAFGDEAAWSCGRKARYKSEEMARSSARLMGAERGVELDTYYCKICHGWHLTSHPRERETGDDELRPSEVLQRARDATMRVREIESERNDLYERIGVQGHSYGFTPKNDVRDPMRHVDEMMDGTADLDREKAECQRDIAAGWMMVDGLRQYDDTSSVKPTTDAEYVLARYYLYAKSVGVIARETRRSMELCRAMIDQTVGFCDEIGYARLAAAARGEKQSV